MADKPTPTGIWEERWHPLREEWVIVAAHRQNRPWSGEIVDSEASEVSEYFADCYLCPGNERVGGAQNENYTGVYVFDNDLPCVGVDAPSDLQTPAGIFRNRPARGIARVICFSPKHDLSLAEMPVNEIENVIKIWQEQYRDLGSREDVNHVLMFENKGDVVGVSNPHPHGQIYATNFVFKTIETESRASAKYFQANGRVLFADVIKAEQQDGRRIIFENETAIAFVPYFARYAYEVYVAPKKTYASVADIPPGEIADFAAALKAVTVKYDNMWRMSFPYVMVLHQAPTNVLTDAKSGSDHTGFHFHIEFHPPLRKPNLLKYLAGPEIGGGSFLSDTAPEEKAAELRSQSEMHYKQEVGA